MRSVGGPRGQLELFLIVRTPAGARRPVSVRIAPDRPVAELREHLAAHLGLDARALRLQAPGRPEPVEAARDVGGLRLRMGDELWLVPGHTTRVGVDPTPVASGWELAVVAGPLAGLRVALRPGEQSLGRGAQADIRLDDAAVSRVHVRLRVDEDGVRLVATGQRGSTYVDGRPVEADHRVVPGEVLEVGRSLLAVRRRSDPAERPLPPPGGRIQFNRPPSPGEVAPPLEFCLPAAPTEPQRLRLPVAAVLTPLLVGLAVWLTSRSVLGLLFALATPLMAIGPAVEERLAGGRQRRRQRREFARRLARAGGELVEVRAAEARSLRAGAPDPVDLEDRARLVLPTLWERRPGRPGFLRLRVGWGDQPSALGVRVPDVGRRDLLEQAEAVAADTARLAAVPLTVDLTEIGALGLAGPPAAAAGLARWLVVQAATLHSPQDLALAAFLPGHAAEDWEWLRWLPHARSAALDAGVPLVAEVPDAQRRLALALRDLVGGRSPAEAADGRRGRQAALLVLVHESAPVERSVFAELLRETAAARVFVLWIGSEPNLLPDGCGAVAELSGAALRLRRLHLATEVVGVPDLVDAEYADRVARALSGVEDLGSPAAGSGLPASVGLLECLGLGDDEDLAAAVRRRWSSAPGDLGAPVGVGPDGVVSLDLREQGPHALVGGTSGSGKSEFLRAWVTALAATHSPRRLNFLLVDFKGGTALQDCARLPHVVGLVTDLGDHHLARVQRSLLAELKRREAELAAAGQKEFVDLERLDPDRSSPVLVIVFDEFEQLLAEHPGFVSDVIVPIARLGRGLGVHLVLGTQRPQGSVPEAVRSNTNIRLALRMLSAAQSQDVVDSSEAARIPLAARGRAHLRLSHASLVPLQVAYAGARAASAPDGPLVLDVRHAAADDAGPVGRSPAGSPGGPAPTDFDRLAHAITAVARSHGLDQPRRPWLPPLPEVLHLAELPPAPRAAAAASWAPLGLVDEPSRQAQWTLGHDLVADGHLLVYGGAGSGKSTLLRTIACAVAKERAPREVWIYGLDFSGGLRTLDALPHVGGVAAADDPERVVQLLRLLAAEVASRRRLVRTRAPSTWRDLGLASILLLVDEYATFRTVFERIDGGRYVDLLEAVVRDGRGVGVTAVLATAQRRDLSGLLVATTGRRLLLRPDRQDQEALGLPPGLRSGPGLPPGRGFVDARLEVQVAVLADGTPGAEEAAVRDLGARLSSRPADRAAPRLEVLPDDLAAAGLPAPLGPMRAVVGLGGDAVSPIEVDLLANGHLIVCGPRGAGRTTALGTVAASVRRGPGAHRLVLLAGRRHSELAAAVEWSAVATGVDGCREIALRLAGELAEATNPGPTIVVVDDAELLTEGASDTALQRLARLGRDLPVRMVAALEVRALRRYSDLLGELRESRHAVLLSPDLVTDPEVFGAGPLPRPLRPWPPGRGFLVRGGQAIPLQVAR